MERNTVLWTLVLFFGASLMFSAIQKTTDNEGVGLALQFVAGLALIGVIVVVMRRRS